MSSKFSFGKSDFDFSLGTDPARVARDTESPFCLALLGDFSGRASRGLVEPLGLRKPWPLDSDNFDQVMSRLEITLRLPNPQQGGEPLELRFRKLDEFHPDQLIQQIKSLLDLSLCRKRLLNPAMAEAATTELEALLHRPATQSANEPPPPAPSESNEALFSRLMEKPSATPPPTKAPIATGFDIQGLIRSAVAGSAVAGPSPHQTTLLSALDAAMTGQLRDILHETYFQALESAWRSIDLLVRNFGGEETIKIYLINVSKDELVADLATREDLQGTEIHKLLQKQGDDQPWAALIGLYTFEDSVKDIEMLGRLSKIAALAGAPFIAGASSHLVGCDSFGEHADPDDWKRAPNADAREAWQALRRLPEAAALGLALPRFLLRQPYGTDSDAIDSFVFEELIGGGPHDSYLWGNAAVVCAHLLMEAFQAEGWQMNATGYGELCELPVYKFKDDGETKVMPCAEAWLNERAGEAILEKGLMPLLSIKGRDAVRLANLQSIRTPGTALTGQWSQS